jgi:hypothetical protein
MKFQQTSRQARTNLPSEQTQPASKNMLVLCLVAMILGFAALLVGIVRPASEEQFEYFMGGAIALSFGVAALGWIKGWYDAPREFSKLAYYGVGLSLAVVLALCIRDFGMRQIGGFNVAISTDLAWRTHSGQIPYQDFPCPFPPFSVLIEKAAFAWFGVSWTAIVLMTALMSFVAFMWSLVPLAGIFGRNWFSLLLAAALQITINVTISFLWHNNITVTADVLFALSATYLFRNQRSWAAFASYTLALTWVAGVKPNSAGLLIVFTTIYLFFKMERKLTVIASSVVAFLLFVLLTAINGIKIPNMIHEYMTVTTRLTPFEHLWEYQGNVERSFWILSSMMIFFPGVYLLIRYRKHMRVWSIPGITFFVGLYSYLTDVDYWICISTMFVGLVFIVHQIRSSLPAAARAASKKGTRKITSPGLAWTRYVTWGCVMIALTGLFQSVCRERVKGCGYPYFFQYDGNAKYKVPEGFFKGLYCSDIFYTILREENEVVSQVKASGVKTNSIWFGPIMEWSYAAHELPSPKGMPVLFEAPAFFPYSQEEMYFRRWLDSDYETVVFFKNFFLAYNQSHVQRIAEAYDIDNHYYTLTVGHRKHR